MSKRLCALCPVFKLALLLPQLSSSVTWKLSPDLRRPYEAFGGPQGVVFPPANGSGNTNENPLIFLLFQPNSTQSFPYIARAAAFLFIFCWDSWRLHMARRCCFSFPLPPPSSSSSPLVQNSHNPAMLFQITGSGVTPWEPHVSRILFFFFFFLALRHNMLSFYVCN